MIPAPASGGLSAVGFHPGARFLAGTREAELKPITFSTLLLSRIFLFFFLCFSNTPSPSLSSPCTPIWVFRGGEAGGSFLCVKLGCSGDNISCLLFCGTFFFTLNVVGGPVREGGPFKVGGKHRTRVEN